MKSTQTVLDFVTPLLSHFTEDCYQGHMNIHIGRARPWLTYYTYADSEPALYRYPIRVASTEEARIHAFYKEHQIPLSTPLEDLPIYLYHVYREQSAKKLRAQFVSMAQTGRKYVNSSSMDLLAKHTAKRFVPPDLLQAVYHADADSQLSNTYIQSQIDHMLSQTPTAPPTLFDPMPQALPSRGLMRQRLRDSIATRPRARATQTDSND